MASAYEDAGVTIHRLPADPALHYQVFSRDSSIWGPDGPIVTQMHQWWRRGEYAPVLDFYAGAEIPIAHMVTAGSFEGGDVVMPAARSRADRPLRGAHAEARGRAGEGLAGGAAAGRCASSPSTRTSCTST